MLIRKHNALVKSLEWATFVTSIMPVFFLAYLIVHYWIDAPWVDQWNTPGSDLIKIREGEYTFSDLFKQHNEHRFLIYRLISIPLAFLTHWDTRYEVSLLFLCACCTSLCFYRLIQITFSAGKIFQILVLTAINLLIFSPIQLDVTGNWLMGVQITFFLSILCLALSVLVSYSKLENHWKFTICIFLCFISSFSFANGLLTWVMVLPMLRILSINKWSSIFEQKKYILIWTACFIITLFMYFYDFKKPAITPKPFNISENLLQGLLFLVTLLGSPLGFRNLLASQIVGSILLCAFLFLCVYLIKHWTDIQLIQRSTGWLTFGFYFLISGISIMLGRGIDGVGVAIWAKYTTIAVYFAVAVIGLLAVVFSHAHVKGYWLPHQSIIKYLGITICIIVLVLHFNSFSQGIMRMKIEKVHRLAGKTCIILSNVVNADNCLINHVYPLIEVGDWNSIESLKEQIPIINEMGFLSPPLLESSKIGVINVHSEELMGNGVFERLTLEESGKYVATGSLTIPKNTNIGNVVLAYGDQGNETIFAIADIAIAYPISVTSMDIATTWKAQFSPDQLPTPLTPVTAWAMDTDTGKMLLLPKTSSQ